MLGELLTEFKGKVTGQRVLEVEPVVMETSVLTKGMIKGMQATETLTFVGSQTNEGGVAHGKGKGVIMVGESEIATYTGEGIGRFGESGMISWRGSVFLRSASNGKLSSLNNVIGVFEAEIDAEGNFSEKSWEWK
jgi:hypothetical protein